MARILISEEEKKRILGMHVDKGYGSFINEQGTAGTPNTTIPKPQEALVPYFQTDPVGSKIAKLQPAFAKWVQTNKINPYIAKFRLGNNDNTVYAVGTDGKNYFLDLRGFTGVIPTDAPQKYLAAWEQVKNKTLELNNEALPNYRGTAAQNKCFDMKVFRPSNVSNPNCSTVEAKWNKFAQEVNLDNLSRLDQYFDFMKVAPIYTPKNQG